MPKNILIYVGANELLGESIDQSVEMIRKMCCEVDFKVAFGQAHTWQGPVAIKDRSKFLATDRSNDGGMLMDPYKQFVHNILEVVQRGADPNWP